MTKHKVEYFSSIVCYHDDCKDRESRPGFYITPPPSPPYSDWLCADHFVAAISDGLFEAVETSATPKMTYHTLTKEAHAQTCTTCEEQATRVCVDDEATCIACLADMTDDGTYALVSTDDGYALAPPKKKEAPDTRSILAGIEVAW